MLLSKSGEDLSQRSSLSNNRDASLIADVRIGPELAENFRDSFPRVAIPKRRDCTRLGVAFEDLDQLGMQFAVVRADQRVRPRSHSDGTLRAAAQRQAWHA